jgi:hypothetical protein
MKTFLRSRDAASKGAALMIVLAFVVLLTGVALAYFNRTTTERQLAQSSYLDTSSDLLARSALDIIANDLKGDLINNPTVTAANIQPMPYGTPITRDIPNLIRRSFSGDPTGRTSSVSSTAASANGRSISLSRWNSHYLIPRANPANASPDSSPVASFTAPDWVVVTGQGPNSAPPLGAVVGRYAFAVYDEGGLLDMNLAGYPGWTGNVNPNPAPSPTPWQTNVGRKGNIAFADLTTLPAAPATTLSQSQIDNIVGWRNWATTKQTGASFGSANFSSGNMNNRQDGWGTYVMDFGDPPYSTPCPSFPFTTVDSVQPPQAGKTDQAVMTRQQLLKLQSSLNFSQNALQYMGTFSRERNQPARDWNRLNNRLPDRYDLGTIGMVIQNPAGTWTPRGRGQGHGGGGFKGRGHYKRDAGVIRDRFGLVWVPGIATDPHNVDYWGHWLYVGAPGLPPNPNPHIPLLRGPASRNDLFQILDFAMTQANADADDIDVLNVADVFALGASIIDQYDAGDPDATLTDADPKTGTHITIIKTGSGVGDFVLGWENVGAPNGEAKAAGDPTDNDPSAPKNPYNWITNDGTATGTKKATPAPGPTPIVLNHAFSNPGDIGYGLRPEYAANRFQRLDFHTANPNASILDFFTYNPVDHNYPRLGVVNLNTKHVPVIAAVLQNALKKDIDTASLPNPFPVVSSSEATAAAQAIINATNPDVGGTRATNRADIGRLTAAAASAIGNPGYTGEELEKLPEVIARALSEVGQTRTWNLMIDVIAQTGRYAPDATDITQANKFIVEGEKRCWLHVALGRDLVGGQVDVLGTQLEVVNE